MSFNIISGLIVTLLGIATIAVALVADSTGRGKLALACLASFIVLVVAVVIRFLALG